MTGTAQVRHCRICEKDVFNLSAMTEAEAESLLLRARGPLCARFYRRQDGTLVTSDCPVGRRRQRRGRIAGVFSALAAMLATACGAGQEEAPVNPHPVESQSAGVKMGEVAIMGKIAPPRPSASDAGVAVMGSPAVPHDDDDSPEVDE
jgi:hypothetical protein